MTENPQSPKSPKDKKSSIKQYQTQMEELEGKYRRALADYQNLLKQTAKEREEYLKFANTQLLAQFLPLLDHLRAAHQHLQDQGLEMIIKHFQQILTNEGITEIRPQPGEQFNPHDHEALDIVPGSPEQQDQVAEVTQIGYKYPDGQVLRHAKVKVFKSLEQEDSNLNLS